MYIGRHFNIDKNILNTVKSIEKYEATALQIFICNPQSGKVKNRTDEELNEIKNYLNEKNRKLVIHSSYVYNFARNKTEIGWALENLKSELIQGSKLGSIGSVIHMGKSLKMKFDEANKNFIDNVREIANFIKEKELNTKLILETPAGQGTELYTTLDSFCDMWNNFTEEEKKYLSICIDTCHIFASGYDLNEKDYLEEFNEKIGLKYLSVVHLNDSKQECGCKKDRHECISEGKIKRESLKDIALKSIDNNIIVILETPIKYDFNIEWKKLME